MATLQEIADKNPNCGNTNADTGSLGCNIEFGTPLHGIAMRKGFIIPKDTVFDKTYIDAQTQIGVFIPVMEADSFEELSSEDAFNTNSRGVDRLSVPGLPKYKLTYQSGHHFYKQISKLTSFKSLDFIFADDEGNWRVAVNANGDFTGFTCGQVTAMMTKTKVQGGDPESKSITVQMLDRQQWDRDYAILERSSLTFSPADIDGPNGVEISVNPIAAVDTTIVFRAILSNDRITPVEGLTETDFLITANGTAVVPTSITEGLNGEYTATVTAQAANAKIVVSTFDSTLQTIAIVSEGVIYKGISAPVVVSA